MSFPTIAYLNEKNKHGQQLMSFAEKDVESASQLTDLLSEVKNSDDGTIREKHEVVTIALESILLQARNLDELQVGQISLESSAAPKESVVKRIWNLIVSFFKLIVSNLKKAWNWIKRAISESKARRDKMIKDLRDLKADLAKQKGNVIPGFVNLKESQVNLFSVNGAVATNMAKEIDRVRSVMNEYRTSKGLRATVATVLQMDDASFKKTFLGTDKTAGYGLLFSKANKAAFDDIYAEDWIKPEGKSTTVTLPGNPDIVLRSVRHLIADRVLLRADPVLDGGQSKHVGYFLEIDKGDSIAINEDNRVIRFESKDDITTLIDSIIALIEESGLFINTLKDIEKIVKKVSQLQALSEKAMHDSSITLDEQIVMASIRNLSALTKNLSVFPSKFFAYSLEVASIQTTLIKHVIKNLVVAK